MPASKSIREQEMRLIKRVSCNKLQLLSINLYLYLYLHLCLYLCIDVSVSIGKRLTTPKRLRCAGSSQQAASGREFPFSGLVKKGPALPCRVGNIPRRTPARSGLGVRAGPASRPGWLPLLPAQASGDFPARLPPAADTAYAQCAASYATRTIC